MNWKELLRSEIEHTYKSTNGLINLTDNDKFDWKPATGKNWMSISQLLMHITNACGACFRGFVTDDWGTPPGVEVNEMSQADMLPTAEKLPTVGSVNESKKLLAEDKQLALDMLAETTEDELANKIATAPWDPTEMILGRRLLQMVVHLGAHKCQLFYYLKLQGKPVNTGNLWG